MLDHPFNIGLLEPISTPALSLLQENAFVYEVPFDSRVYAQLDALVTRGKGQIQKKLIDQCPKLKVIARCGVGVNNIDIDHAKYKGIFVINTPGINADTVAEHTMALILNLQRQIVPLNLAVKNGNWDIRNTYKGDEVRSKTIGIIGFGNIGSKVAKLARTFQMNIIFWNRSHIQSEYQQVSLKTLLRDSDIVSLHLPLNRETYHILDETRLGLTKPDVLIINTGRGELIDQPCLESMLISGRIGGFAADVLTEQPPPEDSPLLSHPNVILTPHAASLTKRTFNDICVRSAQNIIGLLRGDQIPSRFVVV